MAENPQFETLTQSLSPTLQSLEQKRKELKKQGQSTGMGRRGCFRDCLCIFSLYQRCTYWSWYCSWACFVGILQLCKRQISGIILVL